MDARLARPLWRGRTNVDALTISVIERAEGWMREHHSKIAHLFIVTQGSYQGDGGDPDSAGTHARGGVVDLRWCGHDECIYALRWAGAAGTWHRTPTPSWPHHIHSVVYGHPYLAAVAARQITAVLNGRNGLANNGPDDGPRFNPFPKAAWPPVEDEDTMKDEDFKRIEEIVAKQVKAGVRSALDEEININDPGGDPAFKGWTLRRAIKAIARATGAVKKP